LTRPHSSPWAIRHRLIPIQSLDEKDALHPRAGLDGSPLDGKLTHESPEAEALIALMNQLSERERELLYALYWDGKSQREVARELGITQPAVFYRCQRILHKLRRSLLGPEGLSHLEQQRTEEIEEGNKHVQLTEGT